MIMFWLLVFYNSVISCTAICVHDRPSWIYSPYKTSPSLQIFVHETKWGFLNTIFRRIDHEALRFCQQQTNSVREVIFIRLHLHQSRGAIFQIFLLGLQNKAFPTIFFSINTISTQIPHQRPARTQKSNFSSEDG
jgi:hypothetical protein